jgi:hypothetical protein
VRSHRAAAALAQVIDGHWLDGTGRAGLACLRCQWRQRP